MKLQILLVLLAVHAGARAHGGGLDAQGCHTNRKTGDYHCHGGGRAAQAPPAQAQRLAPTPRHDSGPTCYTGPRGGTYTITPSGRKNYAGC